MTDSLLKCTAVTIAGVLVDMVCNRYEGCGCRADWLQGTLVCKGEREWRVEENRVKN